MKLLCCQTTPAAGGSAKPPVTTQGFSPLPRRAPAGAAVRKRTLVLPWAQVLLGVENHLVSLKLLQMESKTTALLGYGKSHLCGGVLLVFLIFFLLKYWSHIICTPWTGLRGLCFSQAVQRCLSEEPWGTMEGLLHLWQCSFPTAQASSQSYMVFQEKYKQ